VKNIFILSLILSAFTLAIKADTTYVSNNTFYNQQSSNQLLADSRKFSYAFRSAHNGNAKAQFDLAIMYATGRGVRKSEKLAFGWFHKSARNNYAVAKHYMGISFLQGRGVRKQPELARYWFRLANKQGYKPSRYYLLEMDKRFINRV
jgi:TPR repeat protein